MPLYSYPWDRFIYINRIGRLSPLSQPVVQQLCRAYLPPLYLVSLEPWGQVVYPADSRIPYNGYILYQAHSLYGQISDQIL